jgi:hypothetical protein
MKRIGEAVMILGALLGVSGAAWLRYVAVTARSFGTGVLVIVLGFGTIALGGALVRLSRSQRYNAESKDIRP